MMNPKKIATQQIKDTNRRIKSGISLLEGSCFILPSAKLMIVKDYS
mgnify:CR=1 FL=1